MTFAKGARTAGPYLAAVTAINARMPSGANFITIPVILYMVSAKDSLNLRKAFPFSPINVADTPRNRANTMIWSIEPLTRACSGLTGMIPIRTSTIPAPALASPAAPSMLSPTPGCMMLPRSSPKMIATTVVERYKIIVLIPMRPSTLGSPIEAAPVMMLAKTRGTMSIFKSPRKILPMRSRRGIRKLEMKVLDCCIGPITKPSTIPIANPIAIFQISGISFLFCIRFTPYEIMIFDKKVFRDTALYLLR